MELLWSAAALLSPQLNATPSHPTSPCLLSRRRHPSPVWVRARKHFFHTSNSNPAFLESPSKLKNPHQPRTPAPILFLPSSPSSDSPSLPPLFLPTSSHHLHPPTAAPNHQPRSLHPAWFLASLVQSLVCQFKGHRVIEVGWEESHPDSEVSHPAQKNPSQTDNIPFGSFISRS